MTIGIYKLYFEHPDSKVYIGSSGNIELRFYQHKFHLKKNKHSSSKMQSDFNRFGMDLSLEVLSECEVCQLNKYETDAIIKHNSIEDGYNSVIVLRGNYVKYDVYAKKTLISDEDFKLGLKPTELILLKYIHAMQEMYDDYQLESHNDLADRVCSSIKTVGTNLKELRKRNLITI